ncbi:MAG: S9 family peptidase [Novosphingobium sp.]|nr:S9 family peptidase [Novosphingobium sp.]
MASQPASASTQESHASMNTPDLPVALHYPETERGKVVDMLFGERVADPYRWLENDVREDPQVAQWVDAQNRVTRGYLDKLPDRDWFENRISALINYERFGIPTKAGHTYFYERNSGLQNQSQLFMRRGLSGKPRLLLDPNTWSGDGADALSSWEPSEKGRYLALSIQQGGSDWRTLRVLDVNKQQLLDDEVRWAKYTDISWLGEEGFFYSRFPAPDKTSQFTGLNYDHAVWFHRVGTPQSADELVFATPDMPQTKHTAEVTSDGRHLVIRSSTGTDDRYELRVIDLKKRKSDGWKPRTLVSGFDNDWQLVEGMGSKLWFVTNKDAPRFRLVAIDLADRDPHWTEIIPEGTDILRHARIVGGHLVVSLLKDASSRALIYDLNGKSVRAITLNGIGSASGFRGRPDDPETFFSFSSFNRPTGIYRMDLTTGKSTVFAAPSTGFEPRDFDVSQRFYTSKDGTRVPMFIVRSKQAAVAGKAQPTLLYGYGGFDVAMTPAFSSIRMAWLEAGGTFAMANLRGGGEYGREWHDGGRLANKQNVFDDFIAAGEFLIAEGITPKGGLAIQGGSNGGLLVGAVVNQRPDLFAAGNAAVGVMDMLRFDKFTAGRYWTDDYGDPSVEKDFRVLRAYSPYHNIRAGADYPALLVTTADTDDRVVPGHSFKYAAALQAAATGDKPHLIRIETRAGHGAGKPTDKIVEEGADVLAFLAYWTGLVPPTPAP